MAPLAILPVLLLLAVPALASADPFGEFRIPDHSWMGGSLSASTSGSWSTDGDAYGETRRSSLDTYLTPYFRRSHDGDALQHGLALRLTGRTYVRDANQSAPSQPQWRDSHEQSLEESWLLTGSLRAYPWAMPLGLGISGTATGSYRQQWARNGEAYLDDGIAYNHRSDNHVYDHVFSAAASVGLGRVRDATVVQDVHILEERLRETGAITRALSAGARERLAALLYAAPAFAGVHERPDRYVWREIERVLRDDAALSGSGLDAYSLLRAREGAVYASTRLRGWFAGPMLGIEHQHTVVRHDLRHSQTWFDGMGGIASYLDYSSPERICASSDVVNLGGSVEYHRPVGWRWQFDAQSQITTPVSPNDDGLDFASNASARWMMADRWEAVASLSHSRNWRDAHDRQPRWISAWATSCGLQLGWYVEDHVQVSASVTGTQNRNEYRYPSDTWYRAFARNAGFSLGLTYRFLRRLDAPGLVEPVRPAAW